MTSTTFQSAQQQAGAIFPDDPTHAPAALHFGNAAAEYNAAQTDCALFDLSDRTQIEITGPDRAKFLHNFCTNDIKKLTPGKGCEAFITNIKGKVLGHVFVFVAENSIWLETVSDAAQPLLNHLNKYTLADDVELHDRTDEYAELFISGPNVFEQLENLISGQLGELEHTSATWNETLLILHRVDLFNTPGILISISCDNLDELWCELIKTIPPAGSQAFHTLRIEAGMPLYGIDITEDNLAQEVGRTSQAISFTKGCYLGQEPIARIDAIGHVNRMLCGLKIDSESLPATGTPIKTEDGTQEVGLITSSTLSPHDRKPVALAYLKSKSSKPGASVRVDSPETSISAIVMPSER